MQQMKVLIAVIIAFITGCIGGTAFAQMAIEVNPKGEYSLAVSAEHWESAGINITDEAQGYIDAAKKAVQSPGEFIPVVTREVAKGMVSPFGFERDLVAHSGVIYDQHTKGIKMVNDSTVLSSSVVFSPFIAWWALAFTAIFLLNIRKPCREAPVYDIAVSAIALFGVVFSLTTISSVTPLLSAVLFFASIVPLALVVGRQEDRESGVMYWPASIVLYVMLIVLLFIAYTS